MALANERSMLEVRCEVMGQRDLSKAIFAPAVPAWYRTVHRTVNYEITVRTVKRTLYRTPYSAQACLCRSRRAWRGRTFRVDALDLDMCVFSFLDLLNATTVFRLGVAAGNMLLQIHAHGLTSGRNPKQAIYRASFLQEHT